MNTHAHTPWRKAILVPFWTLQLLLEIVMLGLFGWALGVLVDYKDDNREDYSISEGNVEISETVVDKAVKTEFPIWITMLALCLVLTITEIVLLARHKLKPLTFVIMNTVKATFWTVIFILDVISTVDDRSRSATGLGIVIEAALYLCFLIPLIYGSIIYHRFRREQKRYKPVVDRNATTEYPSQYKNYIGSPATAPVSQTVDVEGGNQHETYPSSYSHRQDTRLETYRQ